MLLMVYNGGLVNDICNERTKQKEILRSLLRVVVSAQSKSTLIPTSIAALNSKSSQLTSSRAFAAKKSKSSGAKAGNKKAQPKSKSDVKTKSKQDEAVGSSVDDAVHDLISDERNRRRLLDEDNISKILGRNWRRCCRRDYQLEWRRSLMSQ
ncbi:uncharacterized protein LOC111884678 [Lactuca sativa]|uniref:uncharacterized protein LOC111884678 n=1 Tax=Lactuca sativa TaxID=4236 RepID=UPI000CB2DE34|nr:uncharacterized protein LOC111884678 [Lactuca sativa]XP_023736761.1 uncharacterized protein LOC111884678 [Lactuca sativa]